MLSEQRCGNVSPDQHLQPFKPWDRGCTLLLLLEEWKAVSCHFLSCHFHDQHLATSCTSCCFFPSADRWSKSFDNRPQPPVLKRFACVIPLWNDHMPPSLPVSYYRVGKGVEGSSETLNNVLCDVLWKCLSGTSFLVLQPFCFWGFTPKRGRSGKREHWCLCSCVCVCARSLISANFPTLQTPAVCPVIQS